MEIDDIFSLKNKQKEPKPVEKECKSSIKITKKVKGKPKAKTENVETIEFNQKIEKITFKDDDNFADSRGLKRKKTEDGLNVYNTEELSIGLDGGDTDLCPFDCQCCF
jgi:hypothetical protein